MVGFEADTLVFLLVTTIHSTPSLTGAALQFLCIVSGSKLLFLFVQVRVPGQRSSEACGDTQLCPQVGLVNLAFSTGGVITESLKFCLGPVRFPRHHSP